MSEPRLSSAAADGEWAAAHIGGRRWYIGIKQGDDLVDGFVVDGETDASNALWSINKALAAEKLARAQAEADIERRTAAGWKMFHDLESWRHRAEAAEQERDGLKYGWIAAESVGEYKRQIAEIESARDDALARLNRVIEASSIAETARLNAEQERDQLREALYEYGEHSVMCADAQSYGGAKCTCGLDAVLSSVAPPDAAQPLQDAQPTANTGTQDNDDTAGYQLLRRRCNSHMLHVAHVWRDVTGFRWRCDGTARSHSAWGRDSVGGEEP